MKLSLRSLMWAVALTLAGIASGSAEEIRLAPTFDPFVTEVAQTTPITLVGCQDGCADSCTDNNNACCTPQRHVGRDFFVCKDRCGGLIGGFEYLWLRPYASGGLYDTGAGGAQQNFNPAWRTWIGYQNADGLGARMRYFEYNRSAAGAAAGSNLGVEFRTLDAELTQAVDFRRWNLLMSGGIRYAESGVTRNDPNVIAPINSGFSGFGLTTSATATRDLNQSGSLRFVAGSRWSAVYGNSSNTSPAGVVTTNRDDLANILELNIGPQYRRRLRNGAYLTSTIGLEAQYWSNAFTLPGGVGTDAGFAGFSSAVALTR